MKERDIEKGEINRITEHRLCPIRERAFFTIMRQSGLTPDAIRKLRIKHVEGILEADPPIPCKITAPKARNPTFIGEESIKHLQTYLRDKGRKTKVKLTPKSLLFSTKTDPNREINTKDVSRTFKRIIQDLRKNGKIAYEMRERKPSQLRLFSLVKFYRKNATEYLAELSKITEQKTDEFYRSLYEELAMPHLEIEPPNPIELRKIRQEQQQEIERRDRQIRELQERLTNVEKLEQALIARIAEKTGSQPSEWKIEWTKPEQNELAHADILKRVRKRKSIA